ncbi:rab11 family-interacting protein 2-like isoform X1 [Clavelina lepadiformis]|uniref:Rab11 family-interacting protein 1 n=1 Tax=Clavelina lepadiformis TaxID=159417 RepID=A0ABP0F7Z1_CLALP
MWSPTNVVVKVKQARNLLIKAKSGVNDAYAVIEFSKEKYVTDSEKSLNPKWYTECKFPLPSGVVLHSKVVVTVCVYHKRHGKLGIEPDEFLGLVQVPLFSLNSNDGKERSMWYKLISKKKDSKKDRGEIEIGFRFLSEKKELIASDRKSASPKPLRVLTSGIRSKLRRRSEDEDSGVGSSDGDRYHSLGKGRSYENISIPSIFDSQSKPFQRSFRTDSTNSSPGTLHSARGSAKLNVNNSSLHSKAMSVEVLHTPEIKIQKCSSLQRSSSGGSEDGNLAQRIKRHVRNRSMPDSQLTTMMGELHKTERSKSAVCINGSHLYVPGASDTQVANVAISPATKARSLSLTDVTSEKNINDVKPSKVSSANRSNNSSNSKNAKKRYSTTEFEAFKKDQQEKLILPTLYKPRNYYRLDVKELCKVSTIHEDNNASLSSMTHEELVRLASKQQQALKNKDGYINELEDYIDCLLLKVMSSTPQILESKYKVC